MVNFKKEILHITLFYRLTWLDLFKSKLELPELPFLCKLANQLLSMFTFVQNTFLQIKNIISKLCL